MTDKPALHGRDHRLGGADPIPRPSGRMPWILFQGDLNTFTAVTGSDSYPTLTGLLVSPLNAGGTVDSSVFGGIDAGGGQVDIMTGGSSNEPFKAVELLQPGLYMVEFGAGWFLNWGAVRVNHDITHTDGHTSLTTFRLFVNGTENSYFGGNTDATAPQIEVHARTLLAVDERATSVQVRGFIHNHSGVNRTYGTTSGTDQGGMGLSIVQLSSSGHSNP